MDNDDKPVGHVLSRRELLKLLGGSGIVLAVGGGVVNWVGAQTATPTPSPTSTPIPACVVRPELTEGPYFVDVNLNRSDIRLDPTTEIIKAGMPFKLIFNVSDMTDGKCQPLEGAQVDIWHCDAQGVYSGVGSEGTADELWLRGYQLTDEKGIAEFITIYPGWYPGRTVHIHFKIQVNPETNQAYEFTSQLFFEEDMSDLIYEHEAYSRSSYRNTLNEDDNIFNQSGDVLTLELTETTIDDEDGYTATFNIGLDLSDTSVGADDSANNRGGQRRP